MSSSATLIVVRCSICEKQIAKRLAFSQWNVFFCGRKCKEIRFETEIEIETEKEKEKSHVSNWNCNGEGSGAGAC